MRYADHVITINEPIQDLLQSRGLPIGKSTIIMNTADESLFAALSTPVDDSHPDAAKPSFVMMYHGTLTRIYGLDIAIEGLHRARERMPGAELWILGDGPERRALQQLAERFNMSDRVRFIGTVLPQDVHHWLRRCDVGVLATRQDVFLDYSFSNKLSEYIIMGKAVIAARLKTIGHYFSEDALAYFTPEDPVALAERMTLLYGDRTLRESLARNAANQLQPIRWEVMKARYLNMISDVVRGTSKLAQRG
jgi:glycosyltransferase involved in cell wall biosynthesis